MCRMPRDSIFEPISEAQHTTSTHEKVGMIHRCGLVTIPAREEKKEKMMFWDAVEDRLAGEGGLVRGRVGRGHFLRCPRSIFFAKASAASRSKEDGNKISWMRRF